MLIKLKIVVNEKRFWILIIDVKLEIVNNINVKNVLNLKIKNHLTSNFKKKLIEKKAIIFLKLI